MTTISFGTTPPSKNELPFDVIILELRYQNEPLICTLDEDNWICPQELIVHRLYTGDTVTIGENTYTAEPRKDTFGNRVVSVSRREGTIHDFLPNILCKAGSKAQAIAFTGTDTEKNAENWFAAGAHIPIRVEVRVAVHKSSFSSDCETTDTLLEAEHGFLAGTDATLLLKGVEFQRTPELIFARLPGDEDRVRLARMGRIKKFPNPANPNTVLIVSAIN